jgi:hypothetical protein
MLFDPRTVAVTLVFLFIAVLYIGRKASTAIQLQITNDMFIDDPSQLEIFHATIAGSFPPYCSNNNMNFGYPSLLNVSNIDCIIPSFSERFTHGDQANSFFLSTMLQTLDLRSCSESKTKTDPPTLPTHTTTDQTTFVEMCGPTPWNPPTYDFVLGADDTLLSAKSVVLYSSNEDKSNILAALDIHLFHPNNTLYKIYRKTGNSRVSILRMSVHEWLRVAGLDNGLNDLVEEVESDTSIGKPRVRVVGAEISIDVIVKSDFNNIFRFPSYGLTRDNAHIEFHLRAVPEWTRMSLGEKMVNKGDSTSSSSSSRVHLTGHGISFQWNIAEAQVYSLDWFGMIEGMIQMLLVAMLSYVIMGAKQLNISSGAGGTSSTGTGTGTVVVPRPITNTANNNGGEIKTETQAEKRLRTLQELKDQRREAAKATNDVEKQGRRMKKGPGGDRDHPDGSLFG